MIERLRMFWSNDTVRGSMLFFIANMITALGGLLLTIIIARLMGTSEYGVFGTLMGLMYFLVIPVGALDLLITKTVSSFSKVKVLGQTKSFIAFLVKKTGILFLGLFLLLLAITIPLKEYLHIESSFSLILLWIIVYLSIMGTILASTLKGLLNFTPISINLIFSMVVRIATTVLVTYFIFQSHFGGLWGLIIAGILVCCSMDISCVMSGDLLAKNSIEKVWG
jgi:O-antigen/teichoic acid export membrane protein